MDSALGNPTFDLLDKTMQGLSHGVQAGIHSDKDFTRQDARALAGATAFQNMYGVRNMFELLLQQADLPERR